MCQLSVVMDGERRSSSQIVSAPITKKQLHRQQHDYRDHHRAQTSHHRQDDERQECCEMRIAPVLRDTRARCSRQQNRDDRRYDGEEAFQQATTDADGTDPAAASRR
jgi:hypothetical protein